MSRSAANATRPPADDGSISPRLYRFLLSAYPKEFRHEYGPQMAQLFDDCHRAEGLRGSRVGVVRLWARILLDLVQSAPKQHLDSLTKEDSIMKNLRHDALAVLGCTGIIIIAALLLRINQVSSVLIVGYVLDALVVAGILSNLIIFVLLKTTNFNPLRTALWTLLVVNALPVIGLAIIAGVNDPQFNFAGVTVGYVASFLFWFGLHWAWAKRKHSTQGAVVK